MHAQSCTNTEEIVPVLLLPACEWIIRNVLWIQSAHWCDENSHKYALKWALALSFITIQRTAKPSMKFFKRIHSLCFHPTRNKIYSIYGTEDEVTQQAAFWPKLGREAGTAKAESMAERSEREADVGTAGTTTGGLALGGSVRSSWENVNKYKIS